MRTPPLTSRWSEQLHIQLQGSLEIVSLILGGNALNTNESVTKEEEKDGRGGWPPSPPCSSSVRPCDPPPHTASVVLSVKPSVNTRLSPPNRLACIPRSTWCPGSPLRPNSAHHSPPFPETRGPSPPPAGPSFGRFPSQECPLHQAKPALLRSSQGSAPPSFVLSQNEFIPRELRFPARLQRAGRWGGEDTLCSASRWISSAGEVCLSPGLGSGAAGVPPFPTQGLPAQVPGSRSAGLRLSTPQQGGGGPGRRDLGAQRGGGSGQGVSNMLYPPQHTPRRGSEGLRLSRWGGRLPAEGTISPHPPQPQRQNWQGAAGAAGATQRLRRWGGGGRGSGV